MVQPLGPSRFQTARSSAFPKCFAKTHSAEGLTNNKRVDKTIQRRNFMSDFKARAAGLVVLMLLGALSALVSQPTMLGLLNVNERVGTQQDLAFTDGSTSISGSVGTPINPSVPVAYGYRMTNGTVSLELEGSQRTQTDSYSVASGLLNGTLNDTVNSGTSIKLMSSSSGPPQAGPNSSTVLSTTNLVGTHSYDTLELLCGIASCGRIVATGDLTLYVNTLRVEQGTAILANDLASGGLGVGGSTTTSSSGRNDGGGGGGHGGAGGSGGGTNGGSGGSTYGNGTERGSQGGTVSSSYHNTANGGKGGGYIRIFADQVFVNGTIQANGGDGDAGSQASSGTGAGGSGGGGGSGGSIFIRANSVSVGNGGQIKADGGDGGDGANGAQNGPGFGMYDGGDGGGGGGGGRIVISTQTSGYSNSGTVNALGGSGGSKGLKYGTGVDGIDGSGGSNGVVNTGTWSGYISSGNATANNGTFTTNPLQTQTSQPSSAYITHSAAVPSDAALTATYRYTMNGTGSSWSEWSDWLPLSLSGEWVPRHQWLQIEYTFTRSGTTSPELSSMSVQHTSWTTLTGADFRYDGQPLQPALASTVVGLTSSLNNTGTAQQPQFSISVPVGATFSDDLHFWMHWPDASPSNTPSFVEASLAGSPLNSTAMNHTSAGIDVSLPSTALNAVQPTTTWTDGNGLEWHNIVVDIEMSAPTEVWFGHLMLPWSFSTTVDITSAVNAVVLYEFSSYYAFTSLTCFGAATSHRFSLVGSTQPSSAPGFVFTIDEPNFAWEDSYAPQISSIQHRQGVEQLPDLRVNETFSIVLFDVAGEDDLTVEYLGLNWDVSQGFTSAQPLSYHNALQGYYLYLNTDGLEADFQHDYNMTFRVMDANGNELLPRPTYNITVYPVAPVVASLSVTGPTMISSSASTGESLWGIAGAMMTFEVTDAHEREMLSVVAELTHGSSTQPTLLPLMWNPDQRAYTMDWLPMRSDMGVWEVEIKMMELGGLSGADQDGWREGPDLRMTLVDAVGPQITEITHPATIEQGDNFSVGVAWQGDENEVYAGSMAVLHDGSEISNKTILTTNALSSTLVFDSTDWVPGTYTVSVYVEDDAGNPATHDLTEPFMFEVLKPWLQASLTVSVDNISEIVVTGEVFSRSGTATLKLAQQGGDWNASTDLQDGEISLRLSMNEFLTASSVFLFELCDINDSEHCMTWNETLNFEEAFAIDTSSMCTLYQVNATSDAEQTLLTCTVNNRGLTTLTARLVLDATEHITTEAIEVSPGNAGTVHLLMTAGQGDVNETVAWTMLVSNAIDGQKVLEMGQVQAMRTLPQTTTDLGNEPVASGGGSTMLVGIVIAFLVGLSVAGILFYRKERSGDDTLKEFTTLPLDAEPEARWDDDQTTEEPNGFDDFASQPDSSDVAESPTSALRPSPETPATSVDANGYEWYSTQEGHWYRIAGSQDEWTSYQS